LSIKIGIKVRAVRDLPYLGGQAPEDKINEGELVTVERVAGDKLYFEEHADRYGGWPASEFIPDGMFWCPNCENAVSEVYSARSIKLEWDGQTWLETDVFSEGMCCPICSGDIDASHLEPFGLKSPTGDTGKSDKVFYSLCEEDILEVASALGETLTEDEMTQAKSSVADGVGEHWWDVTEDVIGDIIRERRESDGRSESDN